jgi:hypothetical protein
MNTTVVLRVAVVVAGLLTVTTIAPPALADTVPSATGTITDRQTDGPVAGACITVFRAEDQSEVTSVCADSAGTYEIAALPADNYKLRARAAGYADNWVGGKPDWLNAPTLFLSGDFTYPLDFRMWVGAGTIRGMVTDDHGAPAEATVTVERTDGEFWSAIAYTWVGPTGSYEITNVPPGPYRVSISDNVRGFQWAHGKENQEDADIFQIADGATAVVDEQFLPMATVTVRVVDAVTHRLVPGACATVLAGQQPRACAANGVVTVPDVKSGSWQVEASDPNGTHYASSADVDVTRAGPNKVTIVLDQAASIITTVRDAVSRAPVVVCVDLVDPAGHGLSVHGLKFCSDATSGRLVVGPLSPGTVQLLATPLDDTHGALWVTDRGVGTGDQRRAAAVKLKLGKAVTLPPVEVGLAGSISGIVTDRATGAPIGRVCAYHFAFNPGQGGTSGPECSRSADGRYTVGGLGPYDWPIEFTIAPFYGNYAWQWSGDRADRFAATLVRVRPSQTATLDAHMTAGGTLPGTVTNQAGVPQFGSIYVYNALTGDPAAWNFDTGSDPAGNFTVTQLATQPVKVEYYVSGDTRCWYRNRSTFARATSVSVTAGAAAPPIALVDCNG